MYFWLSSVQHSMNDMLKKLCDKVSIDSGDLNISMYTCRHTAATKLGNTPSMSYPWIASRGIQEKCL